MYNYHHTDLKKNGKKFDIFHLEHIIYPFKLLIGDILNHSHFFVKSISRKNIFCACLKHCVLLFLLKNMIRKRDARILKECKLWYQSLLLFFCFDCAKRYAQIVPQEARGHINMEITNTYDLSRLSVALFAHAFTP